ncbi:sugar ABC transporter ATP-binding protein [Demequina sp. B12]|uniref:sugar ABC transporter ATP-binding protein n=1 Tax=Demequina sp. B12 TaxID=2992757 RepID=UPI00237A4951|nr:sugar ABC transporter ATP-binding protein [Demequina sp. B12]MDE0573580.1 sugar ABC transporter ATP-binding protein [Demequina sp. B12]
METETGPQSGTDTLARVSGLWKSFGGVPVLKGVDLDLRAGEIHALVGGNGAGKSTLMKILTGVETADDGVMTIAGKDFRRLNPRTSAAAGVCLVPQEPLLFGNLTVLENVQLAVTDGDRSRAAVERTFANLGHSIDLNLRASDLSISDQQLVELAKGMMRGAKVLIVDEPTAALTAREVDQLFVQLRGLAAQGVGIFYVSHRMSEIFELCQRVTVLRDGAMVLQRDVAETTLGEIVEAMVPNARQDTGRAAALTLDESVAPALTVEGLSGQGFSDISLNVRPGEILGVAGVVGSGRTELAETVFGLRPRIEGSVELCGTVIHKPDPASMQAQGLSYLPEDRREHAVFLLGDIIDNVTCTVLDQVSRGGVIDNTQDRGWAQKASEDLVIQAGSLTRKVGNLSGGNQQKVALGKVLAPAPKVLILDEPTRGIDVAARQDIYDLIRGLADDGVAVILISSDFEEVVQMATSVVVMREGRIETHLDHADVTLESVRNAAFGIGNEGVAA